MKVTNPIEWFNELSQKIQREKGQPITWVFHAFFNAMVPYAVAWLITLGTELEPWRLLIACIGSTIMTAWYLKREAKQEASKKASGSWLKDMGLGITGMIDEWGDSLGPWTVSVVYWLALTLTL